MHLDNTILERIRKEPTPIMNGDSATFVWKGRSAPELVGDFTGWESGESIKLERQSRRLWSYQMNFPHDAYIEYGFINGEENLADPLNSRQTRNGVGGYNNYFSMPGYIPTQLTKYDQSVPHGTIKRYSLPTNNLLIGNVRTVHLYRPPVRRQVPLVVVWDGQDYLRRIHLDYMVDNLIAQQRIKPIALAMVNNGGERSRSIEYSPSEATLAWLMLYVIPLAKKELNLVDTGRHPGQFAVLGASMGGLMAMFTGVRFPQLFGNVLSQSGAYSLGSFNSVIDDLLEIKEKRSLKIWMDVGKYDLAGLLDANRMMHSFLVQRGYTVTYHEYNAGHNFPSWKDDVWRGLEALYGVNK
jgi:enterochelin esterase-like enzyme